jgi:hypothetical protein
VVTAIIGCAKAKFTAIYYEKEQKEYSEATRTATRQMFVSTILAGAPALNEIQKLLENVKSGLTTDGKLNTMLIAKHVEDLIVLTKKYAADEQHDEVATQIVNKMRHITGQLKTNSVIFTAHSMGDEMFMRYLDSCTSMSKTDSEREVKRYIWGPNFNADKQTYASASAKFSTIAKYKIFSDIREMIRYIKPVKPTQELKEWIAETHAKRYAIEDKAKEKKNNRIEAQKLRSQQQKGEFRVERAPTAMRLQDREIQVDEDDGLHEENSQLSTQELLTQMKAMQLAM